MIRSFGSLLLTLKYITLSSVLLLGASKLHAQVREIKNYTGTEVDPVSNKRISITKFTEKKLDGKVESIETNFYTADGKEKVASRKVVFKESPYAPNFVFNNIRTSSMEVLIVRGNQVEMHYRKNADSPALKKTLTVPAPVVVDAGVIEYIKDNWASLKSGKKMAVNLLVVSRLSYYDFALYEESTPADIKAGQTRIVFVSNNWIVRRAVSPIKMVFDNATKQMVRFEGMTNMSDINAEKFTNAVITYKQDQ